MVQTFGYEQFTFIYRGRLSNWEHAPFEIDGDLYRTTMHWMAAQKCRLFGTYPQVQAILRVESPLDAKMIGHEASYLDHDIWRTVGRDIAYRGQMAKFLANPSCAADLRTTAGTLIVRASAEDTLWGIGLAEDDPKRFDTDQWRGGNWLGEIITQVRQDLERARGLADG